MEAATGATKNALQFVDYFSLLLYSGAREKEALRVRWADVDFENGQVAIGADGLAKNHEVRGVDLNPALESLLRAMYDRRAPDSQWLFPSPQRGKQDIPAKAFRESLRLACAAAPVKLFRFHDARHYFISTCVMAGIDFMSIAAWVGHKPGGSAFNPPRTRRLSRCRRRPPHETVAEFRGCRVHGHPERRMRSCMLVGTAPPTPPKQLKNLGGEYGAKAKRILAELLNFNSLSSSWKSNPNSIPKPQPALSILDRTAVANPALGSPRDSPTRRIGNNG